MSASANDTRHGNAELELLTKRFPGRGRPNSTEMPSREMFDPEMGLETFHDANRAPISIGTFQGNGPTFSATNFAKEIGARLDGKAKGWAFAIVTDGGQLFSAQNSAGGDARSPADGGTPMTLTQRVQVASISKTITAVAILRLLEAVGLDKDDFIWPFLPVSWTLGSGVKKLRFRHLLKHRSGFVSSNTNFAATLSYDGLQSMIENGANAGAEYNYLNANFSLFRVILPPLWAASGLSTANNDNAAASAFFYTLYIIEEMFAKMTGGIDNLASTSPFGPNETLYYLDSNDNSGVDFGNYSMVAGGVGWHLSVRDLAVFLANIRYNDEILSPAMRSVMDKQKFGWLRPNNTKGQFGQYLGHNGILKSGGGRLRTGIMKYPIQVEAAMVANSDINGYLSGTALLRDAFDAAWT